MFKASKSIEHEWSKEEIQKMAAKYGYNVDLTPEKCQELVDAFIWNLEDDYDKMELNDCARDLFADILE